VTRSFSLSSSASFSLSSSTAMIV